LRSHLPAHAAEALHRDQVKGFRVLLAICLALCVPSTVGLFLGWPQVLFWPASLGGAGALFSGWQLWRCGRRSAPPRYEVELDERGARGAWAGVPSRPIPWPDVTRIMDGKSGPVVVGRGGRTVLLPTALPELDALRREAERLRAAAPPPRTETHIGLEPRPEPVDQQRADRIARLDRVRPWLGWGCLAAGGGVGLGLLVDPLLAGLCGGLAALLGGLWWALVYGLRAWVLGVSAVSTALVVRTVYRGKLGRFLAAMHAIAGLFFAAMGALVTLACLVGLLG
jgi:hypothetical protein